MRSIHAAFAGAFGILFFVPTEGSAQCEDLVGYPTQCVRELKQQYVDGPSSVSQTISFVVPSLTVGTPEIQLQKTCTPANVVCAGPFTIPPQKVISTPGIDTGPVVTITVSTTGFDIGGVGLGTVGPVTVLVPTPFGPFPVTICQDGCLMVRQPEVDGAVTVTVSAGPQTVSHTVTLP